MKFGELPEVHKEVIKQGLTLYIKAILLKEMMAITEDRNLEDIEGRLTKRLVDQFMQDAQPIYDELVAEILQGAREKGFKFKDEE